MAQKNHKSGLEIEQDMSFERKNWIAERVAWVVMLLIVVAALAGVFGRGGISTKKASSSPAGIEAEYQQFMRYHTPDPIRLKIQRQSPGSNYRLLVGKEFFDLMQIERISPEPESEEVSAEGITFSFKTDPQQGQINITLHTKPDGWGKLRTYLQDNEGRQMSLSHFIYP